MTSTEDLKRLIKERGVRRHERQAILRTLVEDDAPEKLQSRMNTALDNVRAQARKLRKALE
ncbi:MAG: hypothetical protein V3S71_00695 [Acidobacteriota bacterium]